MDLKYFDPNRHYCLEACNTQLINEGEIKMAIAVTFEQVIKPYFTPCYRAHMIKMGPRIDLWDYDTVKDPGTFKRIRDSVEAGFMPAEGCPEGVWDTYTKAQFLVDFDAWKAGGFPR